MLKFWLFTILFNLLCSTFIFSDDEKIDTFLSGLSSTNNDTQYVSFHNLVRFSTNDSVKLKLVEFVKNKFDERDSGKKFDCSYGGGSQIYIDFLNTMIYLNDKRTLPAIIAGSGFFGGGGIQLGVLSFSNEAVPYLIDAMKDKRYYGRAADLTHWLVNDTNCILTEIEKSDLKKALLTGHYENHYAFDEPWLASVVLRLSPTDEEISKYKLLNSIESLVTNTDNTSMGWVPGNIVKIKEKRIKSMLIPIVKRGHEGRLNKKITLNEKSFKAGLSKSFSAAKKTELYNRRKDYLEGERRKVVTELSNTLVELEKE